MNLLRSLLWTAPMIGLLTVVMASISLLATLFDSTGRLPHRIARLWARLLLRASGVRVTVTGAEQLTPGAAYVFCSNHLSLIDTPLVFGHLPWDFRILARSMLWKIPFLGWHLSRSGHMQVTFHDVWASLRSLSDAARRVAEGNSVVVFPEAGRSSDGQMGEFKAGAAYIAIKAGVPAVPMCILGTRQVHTEGSVVVRPGHVELHLGSPVSTRGLTPRHARRLQAELKERIRELMERHAPAAIRRNQRT